MKLVIALQSKVRDMLVAKNEEMNNSHEKEVGKLQAEMMN
jgi:hypothetical protein